jgi:RHS repeat-associated protein
VRELQTAKPSAIHGKQDCETILRHEVTYHLIKTEAENVYSTDYAWARMKGGSTAYAGKKSNYYYRDYTWNERNLLSKTKDDSYTTEYLYGGDGQRAVKRSSVSETLYFNKFFTQRYDDAYQGAGGRMSKHIFLGNDRIVTKQIALSTGETYDNADTAVEKLYTYYYHADHLGSTSVVTDHNGEVYERLEYTPYGETWLDETSGDTYFDTPYRFSAKEKDEETGLYYYGARYLDPKYSRWISADPALGEYLPQAPVNDEAKKHNQSLPGQGGVFNVINLNLYHYAGNNPIKYTDPDGRITGVEEAAVTVGVLVLCAGIGAYMQTGSYQEGVNAAASAASEGLNTVREGMSALANKIKVAFTKNTSDLPSQGKVDGGVEGAPLVDAGKQGKHVYGHPNSKSNKSHWPEGSTGVRETQEAWEKGTKLPDGTKVWDSGKKVGENGETGVRVHSDNDGSIHGYPVDSGAYKKYLNPSEE